MKKCASCTKDLPDAALHCVFCGAKQPPAPAASPAMAKTMMGYGNAELDALRAQAAATNAARPAPSNLPAATPYSAPRPGPSQPPPVGAPPHAGPPHGNYGTPAAAANAATMYVSPAGGPAPMAPGAGQPMGPGPAPMAPGAGQPMGPGPAPMGPGPGYPAPGGPGPMGHPPAAGYAPPPFAAPSAPPPYLASQTAARTGRPIEPWKAGLRLMMFLWGAILLAAFATPVTIDPLSFNWDAILDAEGTAKLPPLIMAAVGLLAIVLAAIPLASAARGMIAMVLGLAGIFVPALLAGMPAWQTLISMVGTVLLIPSLLVRNEYRDATLPRAIVTVGAIAALLPFLVPANGSIPLVELFRAAIEAPGALKVIVILVLGQIMMIVLSLLVWMPSPASGGAKVIAWLLILWPLVMHAAGLFLVGDPSMVEQTPYLGIMSWVAGAQASPAMLGGAGLGVAYLVITGYGTATVLGKQLE